MAAAGFGTLGGPLPGPHDHHLRPARGGAQHQGGSRRPSRRPSSTPTTSTASSRRPASGPVDLFASSGGAVNALALVAAHPEDVRTLVAHEPPLASILPDAENAKAAVRAIARSYQRGGFGAGMAHFIAVVGLTRASSPTGIGTQPGAGPGHVRHAGRRRRFADRRDARTRTSSRAPTTSRTSTPCAPRRPGSPRRPASVARARWRPAAPTPSRSGSGPRSCRSPATTAGSSAASTASRASPTRSPRSSARCSRAA